jgi:hypothetical protein
LKSVQLVSLFLVSMGTDFQFFGLFVEFENCLHSSICFSAKRERTVTWVREVRIVWYEPFVNQSEGSIYVTDQGLRTGKNKLCYYNLSTVKSISTLVSRASVWGRGATRGSPGLGWSILHSDWLTPYCLKISEPDSWK